MVNDPFKSAAGLPQPQKLVGDIFFVSFARGENKNNKKRTGASLELFKKLKSFIFYYSLGEI